MEQVVPGLLRGQVLHLLLTEEVKGHQTLCTTSETISNLSIIV